jgi:hypothetical protein
MPFSTADTDSEYAWIKPISVFAPALMPATGVICGDAGGESGREAFAVMNVCSLEPLGEPVIDICKLELADSD